MPIIHVHMIAGRTAEKKRRLAQAIFDATENSLDIPRASIRVLLHEVPAESWFLGSVADDVSRADGEAFDQTGDADEPGGVPNSAGPRQSSR